MTINNGTPCHIKGCKYVRGVDHHPLRRTSSALGLPVLVHHDRDGRELTPELRDVRSTP